MWENRISGHFEASENVAPPPAPQANVSGGCPHLIQPNDIYRAAHARAVFEYQLGQLFNSGESDE